MEKKNCPDCGNKMRRQRRSVTTLANEWSKIPRATEYWECVTCGFKKGGD